MIEIDGAAGEGGGQILRSALTLSLLTQKPFRIENVRARRPKPGLRPQHLEAVRAAASIGNAELLGDTPGSQMLCFSPGPVQAGSYTFQIKTAGAATLVLQTILIPLCIPNHASHVTIQGGTHVPWSPCAEYLMWAWLPLLARMGLDAEILCERAGFFPRGGGILRSRVKGGSVPAPLELLERDSLERVLVFSAIANLPDHIGARQAEQARKRLNRLDLPIDVQVERYDAIGQGTVLLILPEFRQGHACFFALGERGKPAERVADDAVDRFEHFLIGDSTVDRYLADQILIPLALALLPSHFKTECVTEHLLTNAAVIESFGAAQLEISGEIGQPGHVVIHPLIVSHLD
jgi:RNA 3'-terminal phosphate cyclase (ATP)